MLQLGPCTGNWQEARTSVDLNKRARPEHTTHPLTSPRVKVPSGEHAAHHWGPSNHWLRHPSVCPFVRTQMCSLGGTSVVLTCG